MLATVSYVAFAQPAPQSPVGNAIPITADNFIRAETDLYFGIVVKEGGFGKFEYRREPIAIDKQSVDGSCRTSRRLRFNDAGGQSHEISSPPGADRRLSNFTFRNLGARIAKKIAARM